MSRKTEKAIDILAKRIRTLEARLAGIDERWSCYHEIQEELAAMKRIFKLVTLK